MRHIVYSTLLISAILGAVMSATIAIAEDGQPPATKEAKNRQTRERLARLEQGVKRRAIAGIRTDREAMREIAAAADEFARKVSAGDDAKYARVFEEAINASLRPMHSTPLPRTSDRPRVADPAPDMVDHPAPSIRSIRDSKNYPKNLKKLVEDSQKPGSILLPPSVRIVGGIVDGEDDARALFPDCVAVGDQEGYCCTGTLIAANVVVTAGHCFPCVSQGGKVFFGRDVNQSGKVVEVQKAIRHPNYGIGGHNDLTLLILKEKVDVKPRGIATTSAIDAAPYVRAAGYGTTDFAGTIGYGRRRYVDLPIATADCSGDTDHFGCDPGMELVAGQKMLDKDTCRGDSGGPVYVLVGNEWLVCGATSRATEDAPRVCGDGGIYARLDKHKEEAWFKAVLNEAGGSSPK